MRPIHLKGLGVALVTPFDRNGRVDYAALSRLTDRLVQDGVDYLVVLGTTGEAHTLSPEEQQAVVRSVVAVADRRVPVVLGVGGNCTQAVVDRVAGGDFSGISAILSVVPYYNKPSQEGIYRHYARIAEVAPVPVVLYNVPGRTGVNMTAETTLRLARQLDNVVAIKEASGNVEQIGRILREKPDDFQLISGDDGLAVELIAAGAVGVISVVGNAFPRLFKQVVDQALAGKVAQARTLHEAFGKLLDLLFVDGNPAGIKCALHGMGQMENELRLPLTPVSATVDREIRRIVGELEKKSGLGRLL
jgi:4-hydroxy-tetrahydrodipicolinate synthase